MNSKHIFPSATNNIIINVKKNKNVDNISDSSNKIKDNNELDNNELGNNRLDDNTQDDNEIDDNE